MERTCLEVYPIPSPCSNVVAAGSPIRVTCRKEHACEIRKCCRRPNRQMETVAQKFPICFHDVSRVFPYVSIAEKRIEGIGWGQLIEMASRFLLFSPSFPDFPSAFRGPRRRRVENVCGAHFEAQWGYDGNQPKFPMCFRNVSMAEKKINDAKLLRLIPGWKQPGRGSAPAGSRSGGGLQAPESAIHWSHTPRNGLTLRQCGGLWAIAESAEFSVLRARRATPNPWGCGEQFPALLSVIWLSLHIIAFNLDLCK